MKIVIIGSGNVATHFAKNFQNHGHQILQVYSKTSANAIALADALLTQSISDINAIDKQADLYLIAVSDNAITDIIQKLPKTLDGIIAHTSGATSINILQQFKNFGVIYPAQSINKELQLDFNQIPLGIEGNTAPIEEVLTELALELSPKSFKCNSEQRLALHVSAVFVNNFPNALYRLANEILQEYNLPFDLLHSIILETAKKATEQPLARIQTGPAQRNDTTTINKHLDFLSFSNERTQIYQDLTSFIIKRRQK